MAFNKSFDDGPDAVIGGLGLLFFLLSDVTSFGSGTQRLCTKLTRRFQIDAGVGA
jgi:hypothetical protein